MTTAERIKIIEASCKQVGRGVFFSTLIIVASFLPVFLLEGQEGKLFGPPGQNLLFSPLMPSLR